MSRSEVGAMYGREGTYYGGAPKTFKNDVWMSLIGFDNTREDFGVEELLDRMGFIPDKFLLLLTGIDFINLHRGCDEEYELDPFYCSYEGHPKGDDRAIQRWTNWQLKGLVKVLHQKGIEVYPGFFDFNTPSGSFFDDHPEVYTTKWRNGAISDENRVYMTKRFADGSYYEDFFLQKAIEVLGDYQFDGIHLPDGICRPRRPLQNADYSADMLEQAGIDVPAGENPALYILEHHRREWLDFCTNRWSAYLQKVIGGIHAAGFKVVTNSCWTKDPLEAHYRYGLDYKVLDRTGIDGCVVENGAPTISMIDTESNAGFKQTYADRQLVQHSFRSSLMCTAAQMRNISLQPLYAVRDTNEQYDVIHHLPTALPRHSAAIFSSFLWRADGSLAPVVQGQTYCLGDGLSKDNWRFLRLCNDNAYIPAFREVCGATLIWSDARCTREMEALMNHRTPHTSAWHAALLRQGAAIYKIANIEDLEGVYGDLVVPNFELLPQEEQAKIKAYERGRVFCPSMPRDPTDYSKMVNPEGVGFPYPLLMQPFEEAYLKEMAAQINEGLAYISGYPEECHVQEIRLDNTHTRYIIDNEEFFYTRPTLHTRRPIKAVEVLTHSEGYRPKIEGDRVQLLVPLRGAAILEVEFE